MTDVYKNNYGKLFEVLPVPLKKKLTRKWRNPF